MAAEVKRVAMWSGPRNISTALMRSFENRPDAIVVDEPFYGHWLKITGTAHPGADEVMRSQGTDWRRAAAALLAPLPAGKTVFYQKHMAHHLLPDLGRDWIDEVANAFLIRDPEEMLTSLMKVVPEPSIEETGLPQQLELFRRLADRRGEPPIVVDARDVLEAPEPMLRALCAALGIPFDEAMLAWPAGPRASDGVWAKHWYDSVERSTGFAPWRPKPDRVPERQRDLLARCREIYDSLHRERLTP